MSKKDKEEEKKIIDTRKLVKWGSSETLIMSLPRPWVKKFQLTKDSEVSIIENQDGSLLVNPLSLMDERPKFETTVEFDANDVEDKDLIELEITTRYLDGSDSIFIEAKVSKDLEKFPAKFISKVQEVVQSLLGLEITSLLSRTIKIQDIMSIHETNIDVLVRIISDTTIDFFQNLIDLVKSEGDIEASMESIAISKKQVRKYYLRILRELRKGLLIPTSLSKMGLTAQDTVDLAFFITDVNETSEKLEFILHNLTAPHVESKSDLIIDEFIEFMKIVNDIFKNAVDAFLFRKKKSAIETIKTVPSLEAKKRDMENRMDEFTESEKYIHFQIILDILSKILDHSYSIALTALRRII